jgi:hypothetical protein
VSLLVDVDVVPGTVDSKDKTTSPGRTVSCILQNKARVKRKRQVLAGCTSSDT